MGAWELVRDLAHADAGDRLAAFRKGEAVPASREQLATLRNKTADWRAVGMYCSDRQPPA